MDIRRHTRRWKSLIAVGLATALTGAVAASAPSASAETEKVAIYFAVCDGNADTDTVKIKKIYEDGSGITTIGDTTIAHCNNNATRFLSGLAVSGDYAYFSWMTADSSAAGIGRIKTDAPNNANVNYISAPAGTTWLQISAKPLGDSLIAISHGGTFLNPTSFKLHRVNMASASIQDCHNAPDATAMSMGVGIDAIYFALQTAATPDPDRQRLYRITAECSTPTVALDLASDLVGSFHDMDPGTNASLVTETDQLLFVSTFLGQTQGLSRLTKGQSLSDFTAHEITLTDEMVGRAVWGFDYIYFKNDMGADKMYRVKPGGTPEQVFADHIKGVLHHMSVVKETPAAPAAPTTPAVTKAPLLVSKKGVTGKQVAKDLGLTVKRGSKISLTVAKKSSKVCALNKNKTRVVRLKKGKKCRVTITITPKKGKAIKRTTSFTTS